VDLPNLCAAYLAHLDGLGWDQPAFLAVLKEEGRVEPLIFVQEIPGHLKRFKDEWGEAFPPDVVALFFICEAWQVKRDRDSVLPSKGTIADQPDARESRQLVCVSNEGTILVMHIRGEFDVTVTHPGAVIDNAGAVATMQSIWEVYAPVVPT
jgi:hypothetical protein